MTQAPQPSHGHPNRAAGGATGRAAAPIDARVVLDAFNRAVDGPLAIPSALETLCRTMPALVDATHAAVWLHERRARALVLATSTPPPGPAFRPRVATADLVAPLVAALRQAQPTSSGEGGATTLLLPLRGRRRALGVLLVALHAGADRDAALDVCRRVAEGISGTIENVQLLDDVLRSRRQLENVFDSLRELVAVTDTAGRIAHVNQAFAGRLGVRPPALVDAPLLARVGTSLASWINAHAGRLTLGTPAHATISDEMLGGTLDVTLSVLPPVAAPRTAADPIATAGGHVLVARDVTAERQQAEERRELEQRLARSEKLLALGQFVAGIAHELNNPLQGVLGHLELLRARQKLPPALRRDLAIVYRDADRAARVVQNLLLFAGSGRLRMRVVSVNALVERVLRLRAAAHARHGIAVMRRYDPRAPKISADAVLLQQAVLNVVMNAEQAMAKAGTLRVRTSMSRRGVSVTIEDTGPGLTRDVQARLFEPFFTTRQVGHGTGLGLAMVFGIVQAHNGAIEASNRAQGGARFTITFPAARAARAAARR